MKEQELITKYGLRIGLKGLEKMIFADKCKPSEIESIDLQYIKSHKQEIIEAIEYDSLEGKINRINKLYPHIQEIKDAVWYEIKQQDKFNREMENGNGIISADLKPKSDKLRQEYPEDNAALMIIKWADTDPSSDVGFQKRTLGKNAINRLLAGEKATTVFADISGQLIIKDNS